MLQEPSNLPKPTAEPTAEEFARELAEAHRYKGDYENSQLLQRWAELGRLVPKHLGGYGVVGQNRAVWLGPWDNHSMQVWLFAREEDAKAYAKAAYSRARYDVEVIHYQPRTPGS